MQVHMLSFEGPNAYARAGGLASRMAGLAAALAAAGCDTHLWCIGDPEFPGHETRGHLRLHRWCQWISRYHPAGVYDGEEGKHADYAASLPPFLFHHLLRPALQRGERAVIMAEEWHTVQAVRHLDWLLRTSGLRDRCAILWNANNTVAFDRIDWARLRQAAVMSTVSRYMKQRMWGLGVDPLVLPNGLAAEAFMPPAPGTMAAFQARVRGCTVLSKVARWDPDKRWLLAIETVSALQRQHWQPLLIARGGVEAHGSEVLTAAGQEFVSLYGVLHDDPGRERAMRRAGRATAQRYSWPQMVQEVVLPRLWMLVRAPHRRRRNAVPSGVRLGVPSAHPVTSAPGQALWRCGGDTAEPLGHRRRQLQRTAAEEGADAPDQAHGGSTTVQPSRCRGS